MASRPEAALAAWLHGRAAQWQRLSRILAEVSARRQAELTQLKELVRGYRALARDVSLARAAAPDAKLVARLEALLTQAREVIHRRPGNVRDALAGLFRDGAPRVAFELRGRIAAVIALFLASAVAGWWLVRSYPELAALFASEQMINRVQRGELWTDGLINIVPSALLSLGIMTNNIVVSLFAFTLGALYGLGTLYIVGMNGLMLGGVFAMTAQHGLAACRSYRYHRRGDPAATAAESNSRGFGAPGNRSRRGAWRRCRTANATGVRAVPGRRPIDRRIRLARPAFTMAQRCHRRGLLAASDAAAAVAATAAVAQPLRPVAVDARFVERSTARSSWAGTVVSPVRRCAAAASFRAPTAFPRRRSW